MPTNSTRLDPDDEAVDEGFATNLATDSIPQNGNEQKFIRLRDEWKAQRGPSSSTVKLVMHPAYQTIIGMGRSAIPFLLRELETNIDNWFWALRAITEADPVREEDRGDGRAMAKAWLAWGSDQGYQW